VSWCFAQLELRFHYYYCVTHWCTCSALVDSVQRMWWVSGVPVVQIAWHVICLVAQQLRRQRSGRQRAIKSPLLVRCMYSCYACGFSTPSLSAAYSIACAAVCGLAPRRDCNGKHVHAPQTIAGAVQRAHHVCQQSACLCLGLAHSFISKLHLQHGMLCMHYRCAKHTQHATMRCAQQARHAWCVEHSAN
jgi:hypothetical protein